MSAGGFTSISTKGSSAVIDTLVPHVVVPYTEFLEYRGRSRRSRKTVAERGQPDRRRTFEMAEVAVAVAKRRDEPATRNS